MAHYAQLGKKVQNTSTVVKPAPITWFERSVGKNRTGPALTCLARIAATDPAVATTSIGTKLWNGVSLSRVTDAARGRRARKLPS